MAFSDLQIKVASETAVMGLQKHMASLKYFAKDVKPTADRPFAGVQVPVYSLTEAAEFDENTNNWCGGKNEVDGVVVTLDKHLIKSISLDDVSAGDNPLCVLEVPDDALGSVKVYVDGDYRYEYLVTLLHDSDVLVVNRATSL